MQTSPLGDAAETVAVGLLTVAELESERAWKGAAESVEGAMEIAGLLALAGLGLAGAGAELGLGGKTGGFEEAFGGLD